MSILCAYSLLATSYQMYMYVFGATLQLLMPTFWIKIQEKLYFHKIEMKCGKNWMKIEMKCGNLTENE